MIQFSRDFLRDRIYACWIGKNIGGTLGTPYEGQQQLNDIHGFASQAGEPQSRTNNQNARKRS